MSQAWTIRLPSCQRVAIGFSVITWRPASATCTAWSAWSPLGVARITMSASVPASMASSERNPGAPVRSTALAERRRVDVAHADQLGPVGVLLEGVEVVGRDPAAARQREPDLAVADEGLGDEHGSAKCKWDRCLQGIAAVSGRAALGVRAGALWRRIGIL